VITGVVLRPAGPADLGPVERLIATADLPLDGLRDQFGDGYAVAVADGAIVGVEGIEVHGRDGLLRSAAVSPEWRGRGVGDALTRDRLAWAQQRGLDAVYLLTTTAGDWFPRFGFRPADRAEAPDAIQRSREFAEACPDSALFMKLQLETTSDE
jgi:N-acetylglutamate synthase-like GNAT family acetyltransferase